MTEFDTDFDTDNAATKPLETEVLDAPVLESPAEQTSTDVASPRPRVRWGALIWGLLAIAIVGWTLSIVGSPSSRAGFVQWFSGLTAGGWIVVGVLALGGFILLRGLVAVLKLTQRSRD